MNAAVIAQTPLVAAFALLLVLGASPKDRAPLASALVAVFGLLASAALVWLRLEPGDTFFGGAYLVTGVGKALAVLCLGLTAAAVALGHGYLEKVRARATDWRIVVLALAMGLLSLCLAGDLATLFIAFELISIPSYVLCGFSLRDPRANEAGIKYLLLGAVGSVLFLLGLGFLYGATGEIALPAIAEKLAEANAGTLAVAKLALGFVLAALFFKTAVAPFHLWLADVYQGSSFAALSVVASPVKVAVFGLLFTLLHGPFASLEETWKPALYACAAASAVIGNVQALAQKQLRRLFAYSAVVNGAFILLTVAARSPQAFLFYVSAYGLMGLGLWAAFMALGTPHADVDELDDLRGLSGRHPLAALGLSVIVLSYAGLPLTAGFTAKFAAVVASVRDAGSGSLALTVVIVALVASVASFAYYFQILRHLWLVPLPEGSQALARHMRPNQLVVFALVVGLLLTLSFLLPLPALFG
ncbi:MAG: NADH-quinone oxidoreductase subunit N [Myxococcales bacterium]|nr:NADH-quinone oxidoreductase subunit N [Myxococcales bacterium]